MYMSVHNFIDLDSRSGSSEVPQKVSPRAVRRLRPTALDSVSTSSSNQVRTPKEKSPKVAERRSPNSPAPEKKRPSRISELESQVSQLQDELKKARDQLALSESCKNQALEHAEESKKQLAVVSSQLEDLQKQLLELSSSEKPFVAELQKISQERDQAWQSQLESVQELHLVDSAALVSAASEIQQLKVQLEMVAEFEAEQNKQAESNDTELQTLKANLIDTLSLVENMKNQLTNSKESDAQNQALASETLKQLETAKRSVEVLRFDSMKAIVAYNSIASELEQSRERVNLLEQLVSKLEAERNGANINHSPNSKHHYNTEQINSGENGLLEAELCSLKSEVEQLKCALEAAEIKCQEERENNEKMRNANELMEELKSASAQREAELDAELKQAKADLEQLRADLMDKETELQGISEENEGLSMKLKKSFSSHRESELENELRTLKEIVADLKSNLMDKETELQNISEENELLKLEISRRENTRGRAHNEVVELEAARTAEREALMKLGLAMEEADKSNKKVARVTEQLEAVQAANAEMEAELRRLKVQSDQWRKAAEAAASMLSAGNNGKFMERTGSMDSAYNPVSGKIDSPYNDDIDDDLKKKNGNMLKKIGVLWKKTPQK